MRDHCEEILAKLGAVGLGVMAAVDMAGEVPSMRRLAKRCKVSQRKARAIIDTAVAAGWLTKPDGWQPKPPCAPKMRIPPPGALFDKGRPKVKEVAEDAPAAAVAKKCELPPIPPELDTPEFRVAWEEWIKDRKERRKTLTPKAASMQLARMAGYGPAIGIEAIRRSMESQWTGIFPERVNGTKATGSAKPIPGVYQGPGTIGPGRKAQAVRPR